MEKPAKTDHPVHELIQKRWSPRAFSDRPIEKAALSSLLEAARWAPSGYNEQPWHFLIARKEDGEAFEAMLSCLAELNQTWARNARVLMISVARTTFSRNGKPNRHAWYDTGQAVAVLSVQATSLGIRVHQMGGFDPEKARKIYDIPEGYEAVTAIALGYHGNPETLPEKLRSPEIAPRQRRSVREFAFSGQWNTPL